MLKCIWRENLPDAILLDWEDCLKWQHDFLVKFFITFFLVETFKFIWCTNNTPSNSILNNYMILPISQWFYNIKYSRVHFYIPKLKWIAAHGICARNILTTFEVNDTFSTTYNTVWYHTLYYWFAYIELIEKITVHLNISRLRQFEYQKDYQLKEFML